MGEVKLRVAFMSWPDKPGASKAQLVPSEQERIPLGDRGKSIESNKEEDGVDSTQNPYAVAHRSFVQHAQLALPRAPLESSSGRCLVIGVLMAAGADGCWC